ncbi:hypothetical protein JE959_000174 [Aeromonas veronii]|nr:hypothetical protein [Aeromonas veronii]
MEEKDILFGVKVVSANGTYFVEGSILPVYADGDFNLKVVEEYEKGEPVEHPLHDLIDDGVVFERVPASEVVL